MQGKIPQECQQHPKAGRGWEGEGSLRFFAFFFIFYFGRGREGGEGIACFYLHFYKMTREVAIHCEKCVCTDL